MGRKKRKLKVSGKVQLPGMGKRILLAQLILEQRRGNKLKNS